MGPLLVERVALIVQPRDGMDSTMRQVMNQYAPMVGAFLMSDTGGLVDQFMAAVLGLGAVCRADWPVAEVSLDLLQGML